jgi:ATP-dependent protease ClpP protease subunit
MPVEMKASGDAVTITLHGDVGWDITPQAVAAALKTAAGKPLSVAIHSYGGDAMAGIAIHNMLARHDGAKTVVIDGIAASAASLIAMAGDRIVLPENGFMLIHNASGLAMGTSDVAREVADTLDKITAAYRRTYATRSGKSEDEIQALMDADAWLSAAEALDLGLVTEVSAPADIRMDARRLNAFTNLPAALVAATRPAEPANSKETPRMSAVSTEPAEKPVNTAPTAATLEQIEAVAAKAKLSADFVLAQIKAKAPMTAVMDAALDALSAKAAEAVAAANVNATAAQFPAGLAPVAQIVRDEGETRAEMIGAAIAHMADAGRNPLPEGARQYRGLRLTQMAEVCLNAQGLRTRGKTPWEIAEMALSPRNFRMAGEHSSSDFASILANTASKAMRAAYTEAPRTFTPWTQRMDLPDFKSFTSLNLSSMGPLVPVSEGGGVQYGALSDSGQAWSIARYNTGVALTFVAMVNDDLSAFARIPALAAQAAARLESDLVYKVLLANGTMTETTGALFNATATTTAGGHGNLNTGSTSDLTPDADGIAAMGVLARMIANQRAPIAKGPGLGPAMGLRGRYLLVPSTVETAALQLFSPDLMPGVPNVVNPRRRSYDVIVEPRLNLGVTIGDTTTNGSDTAYYLIAEGIDTVHWGYLRGESGPTVSSEPDFDTDGMKLKVVHHFGAAAVEWRGMAKSAGA